MIHLDKAHWTLATNSQLDAIHIMDGLSYRVENYTDDSWILITVPEGGSIGDHAIVVDRLRNSFPRYRMLSVSTAEIQYAAQLGATASDSNSTWREDWEAQWMEESQDSE